ncbi:MAG: NAD(P)-dependent oxidoreductase [Hyphomicrobiaceae bacterium]
MAITIAMTEKGHASVSERLDALGLGLRVHLLRSDGRFDVDGTPVRPEDFGVDMVWLSPDISSDNRTTEVFDVLERCRSIGVLETFNTGLDRPVYRTLAERGVTICNSNAQSVAIAEFVLAHVLARFHPLETLRQAQADKLWKVQRFREISGTRWLIVGFGPIGQAIAQRAKAFDAHITVVRRSTAQHALADRCGTLNDLEAFAAEADVIIVACPLNAATAGAVNARVFARTQPDAMLVNIGRGAVVDDDALLAALDEGRLGHAVLDVFAVEPLPDESRYWSHPKVTVTPHCSFAGSGTWRRWETLFLENVARLARGVPLERVVRREDI